VLQALVCSSASFRAILRFRANLMLLTAEQDSNVLCVLSAVVRPCETAVAVAATSSITHATNSVACVLSALVAGRSEHSAVRGGMCVSCGCIYWGWHVPKAIIDPNTLGCAVLVCV
jgi:hypothetical protein